ncbi:helix-turn-helix transcriptional regulator [Aestuariimicrobium soli]|uniref:helix-turn-helix transcriptional regulator n=1 Tax=Aestuariimicrobium soli TaxID=2035834 RepID=UPI003EBBECC1
MNDQGQQLGTTRAQVLQTVQQSGAPVGVAEVAAALSLHPNSVRHHLEELSAAGHLSRVVESRGQQGRPPARYTVTAQAPTLGQTHLVELAQVLIDEFVVEADSRDSRLVKAGRGWGRRLADDGGDTTQADDDLVVVARVLGERGFSALADERRVTFVKCPFRGVLAGEQLQAACHLHRGFIEGVLEQRQSSERLDDLQVGRTECVATFA